MPGQMWATRRPHRGDRHYALDGKLVKPHRWKGSADYIWQLMKDAEKAGAKVREAK
jgi:hypothetical protein